MVQPFLDIVEMFYSLFIYSNVFSLPAFFNLIFIIIKHQFSLDSNFYSIIKKHIQKFSIDMFFKCFFFNKSSNIL